MRLLLDANLSPRLVAALADLFPGSTHVFDHGEIAADDVAIWRLAASGGFTIVTKDTDFLELALLRGPPPKVILVRTGNAPTSAIGALIRQSAAAIGSFNDDPEQSVLVVGSA